MQKLTLEKQINLLEREVQSKQNKIEELTKTANQQQKNLDKQNTQIRDLQDVQKNMSTQLFDIKQERDSLKYLNEIKEKQIQSLQEQVLVKNHVADTQQLKHELQQQYNQILELQLELQTVRNNLEHSELERQNLSNELKTKAVSQVVYIQNKINNTPLQIYNQHLDQFDEERKQYQRQIHQYQMHENKIKIENQKTIDKLQSIITNFEEEKKNLQEELMTLKQMMEMYQLQAQDEISNQKKEEELKLQNDREMRTILENKDKLISDQEKEIQRLHKRISQSPEMSLSTINDMFNINVDDIVDLKIKIMQQENDIKLLQDQIVKEQQDKRNIQEHIQRELNVVSQKKQEYLQSISFSELQKQKLETEIQQNKILRDNLSKLQTELNQFKIKDQIQRNEIDRLRQDNLNQKASIVESEKKGSINRSTIQSESIIMSQEYNKNPINQVKQFEKLTQEILNLKLIINRKDEEIINLQQKIISIDSDDDLEEQQKKSSIQVSKKIEKIRCKSQKKSQFLAEYRKLKLERNKFEFQIQEQIYEISKLQNQVQMERSQKEFMEKNLKQYQDEFLKLEGQYRKQKKEFENKIQQISQEMEQNFVSKEQINYHQQNQQLFQQKELDKKLILDLKEKVKTLNLESQKMKEEIFQKDNLIQQLRVKENKNEEKQYILQMKLQIENDKIIINSQNERINNLIQQLEDKEKELQSFQQDKLDWEQLQQFSRQIANENRSNSNNQEDINDLKKNLKGLQKKLSEQTLEYQQTIADFGKEFQKTIMKQNSEIQQLEQENQDLAIALEQYQQLYQQERIDSLNKSDLTLVEVEELKQRLVQVTQERDQLSIKKEIIEKKEQFLQRKEEDIRFQNEELNEEKKNFENHIEKKKSEITEDILIKRNKELSIIGCDYILGRELGIYKQKLIEEQEKYNELMKRSFQQIEDPNQKGNQDLYEKKIMENQLNDLKKQIEEMRAEQLKLKMDTKIQIEEQLNFQEERQQYQQQITQLMHLKENVTLEDVKLVREIIQNGKLISYLERAKDIHELQNQMHS
ncbi:unnamed protein product [Paramecium sonneborni]|uniref:Uncharacterized protein n=1 Tax=Paramecium sonneborni TaxID=65129 RepID=A0A8S1R3X8_9CILI|nr:unnamed protein product [Paramecium sonneborni]